MTFRVLIALLISLLVFKARANNRPSIGNLKVPAVEPELPKKEALFEKELARGTGILNTARTRLRRFVEIQTSKGLASEKILELAFKELHASLQNYKEDLMGNPKLREELRSPKFLGFLKQAQDQATLAKIEILGEDWEEKQRTSLISPYLDDLHELWAYIQWLKITY